MNKKYAHLREINNHANNLNSKLGEINKLLIDSGNTEIGNTSNGLEQYHKDHPKSSGLYGHINQALTSAAAMSKKYQSALKTEQIQLEISIHTRRQTRKAERKDMWILWSQKTVRWIASAALIVLLYSSTVWLSQHYNFIKVPVKDWIATPEKVTAANNK